MTEFGHSLDCDGVLMSRVPVQFKALMGQRNPEVYRKPKLVLQLNRQIDESRLTPKEIPSFLLHFLKRMLPAARQALGLLDPEHIYLNTGRPNKRPWVDLTAKSFRDIGVDHCFRWMYFRPNQVSTMLSKAEAIGRLRERYETVMHYDDNPFDGLPIASYFPDVQVFLIRDLSTNFLLSRVDRKQLPNVYIAENLLEAVKIGRSLP